MPSLEEEEEEEEEEEFQQAFELASSRRPQKDSYGFLAHDDAPGGIGGGAGGFCWFLSELEMMQFIHKFPLLAQSIPDDIGEPSDIRFSQVKEVIETCLAKGTLNQTAVNSINRIISGVEQIKWFGQLGDLMSGDQSFSICTRQDFLKSDDVRQIDDAEIESFIDFLEEWAS